MGHQHGEVCASGATFAWFVSELTLELIQGLVQLVLRHQVASIMAQLRGDKQIQTQEVYHALNMNWKKKVEITAQHIENVKQCYGLMVSVKSDGDAESGVLE